MSVWGRSARLRLFPDQDFEIRFGAPSDSNTIVLHLRTRFPYAERVAEHKTHPEPSDSLLELSG